MTSMTDFTNTRREMKYSLYDALDCAKVLEEKYQAVVQLVEILTHSNYKKDRKIQKLSQKLKKCKSDAKYRDRHFPQEEELENEELEEEPQKEVIDLTQIPEEEEPPIIPQPPKIKIEKIAKKVKIEEPVIIVIEEEEVVDDIVEEVEEEMVETEVEEEVVEEVETEVEEVVEEMVEEMVEMVEIITETEIEEQEEEENIEPELEPDVISEPEENQPTEEPILEKDDDDNMELIIEDPEEQEEQIVEETAEEEEEELYEVVIGKTSYYVANEENGPIYEITADQEVGEEVGQYVNRKPVFQPKSSTAPESQTEPETQEEEEEIELIQIKINNVNYAIENEIDGPIYSLGFDGDVDEEVGKYVKGKPTFYKK